MHKRSPLLPPGFHGTKRLALDPVFKADIESSNADLQPVIQVLSDRSSTSAQTLGIILDVITRFAPDKAHMKRCTPLEHSKCIECDPALKDALEDAINRNDFRDIMLMCKYS